MLHPNQISAVFKFDNGYGASVVRYRGPYSFDEGLYELAVARFDEFDRYEFVYDTPITGDVLGWLTEDQVMQKLKEIEALTF